MIDRKPTLCNCGDHAFVRATRWGVALVSPQDQHLLVDPWCLAVPKPGYAYVRSMLWAKVIGGAGYLHRVIFPDAPMVDHKDGNGLDCRRSNIRRASRQLNRVNVHRPVRAISGFYGVFHNAGRGPEWKAAIKVGQRTIHLGYFDDPQLAADARDIAATKHFGEFATLNGQR